MNWTAVCELDDLNPNCGAAALVDGRQLALFRLDETDLVLAIGNHDPFADANVMSRGIVGDMEGQLVVASPIYKHHFNLVTGQCLEDADVRLPVWEVKVEGDTVWVRRDQPDLLESAA